MTDEWAAAQRYGEGCRVVALDAEARVATLADGRRLRYEALVTTAPLDATLGLLGQRAWADALTHRHASHQAVWTEM